MSRIVNRHTNQSTPPPRRSQVPQFPPILLLNSAFYITSPFFVSHIHTKHGRPTFRDVNDEDELRAPNLSRLGEGGKSLRIPRYKRERKTSVASAGENSGSSSTRIHHGVTSFFFPSFKSKQQQQHQIHRQYKECKGLL